MNSRNEAAAKKLLATLEARGYCARIVGSTLRLKPSPMPAEVVRVIDRATLGKLLALFDERDALLAGQSTT